MFIKQKQHFLDSYEMFMSQIQPTLSNTMILEELRFPQRVDKFPCFQETRYFIVLFIRTRHHFLQYLSGESNTLQSFMLVISHSYAWLYQPLVLLNKVIITAKISSRISVHYWVEMWSTRSCKKFSVFITLIKIRTHFWMIFYKICEIKCEQWDKLSKNE
jgi:hypothetical protein